jgi:hypothetical protein
MDFGIAPRAAGRRAEIDPAEAQRQHVTLNEHTRRRQRAPSVRLTSHFYGRESTFAAS